MDPGTERVISMWIRNTDTEYRTQFSHSEMGPDPDSERAWIRNTDQTHIHSQQQSNHLYVMHLLKCVPHIAVSVRKGGLDPVLKKNNYIMIV